MTFFGRGDAILRYPELIEGYAHDPACIHALDRIEQMEPYVAVHIHASEAKKIPPHPEILTGGLIRAGVPFVLVGNESHDMPPNFRLHADVVRKAAKFIGTLSVFNVIAQIAKVPSFVLVNRSVKEPVIYDLMERNGAWVTPWNVGNTLEATYAEAIRWAQS
jgi:hypothetical protein